MKDIPASCRTKSTSACKPPGCITPEPADMGPVTVAVFDDTCGNPIQIAGENRA